ncbi:MAG TPA: malonyl-CoA decarboxylase [Kiloniellales bacterium]
MGEVQQPSFFEKTFANLAEAWRDVAASAARSVGLTRADARGPRSDRALRALMTECLEARGGEVSARMRAAELGKCYLELDAAGKRRFLEILAHGFAVNQTLVEDRILSYRSAETSEQQLKAEAGLRNALQPPRVKLLTQFNALPEGVKFLVDMRAELLPHVAEDPHLKALDADLRELLVSWFDVGFLDLRQITWDSPASLLEKVIAYEAVHEIRSWDDLHNRLESDRRLYALFHPRMPNEPLAFVEVALVRGLAGNIQAVLDEQAPSEDVDGQDTAIFYSITNTQRGLKGVSFGDYLIKRVVDLLSRELPQLKTFATLSPVPGFARWLARAKPEDLAPAFGEDDRAVLCQWAGRDDLRDALAVLVERPEWRNDRVLADRLKWPLMRLCARYLETTRPDGRPIDPVARFHFKNGARLERVNWMANAAPNGLRESLGLMVNYRYVREDIERNHEAYMEKGRLALSSEVKALLKPQR